MRIGWVIVGLAIIGLTARQARPIDNTAELSNSPTGLKRVVALAPNAAEIICGLGACDRLVGVSSFCTHPAEIGRLPRIGGLRDPDLELLVALKPDLLILRGRGAASQPLRDLAREQNIRIYDDDVETLGDLYKTIGDLGTLLDRKQQARTMVRDIRDELAAIRSSVADRPRVRALFTLRSPTRLSNVFAAGTGTFIDELIAVAGGENVCGESAVRYPQISLEEIVARDPEVIIESMPAERFDKRRRAELLAQWQALGRISAVENERVHFVTEEYLTIPSQRVVLAARKLLSLIHPEIASGER